MIKLNKKGLSVVELIVSFVLCLLVFIFIIQVVTAVEELYINLGIKTELLNKQALISEKMNAKLDNETILIKSCGDDCLIFFYRDQSFQKMQIDKNENTFIIGDDVFDFNGLGFVDSLKATVASDYAYSMSILTISLDIKNSIFDSGKYVIKSYLQYNSDEVVYSPSNSKKAEIFLLGPAVSYKFSEDLFIEPGWIVYYPSGKITINENDVKSSGIEYDSDDNGFVRYQGVGEAAGSEKTRTIRNYKIAKDYIVDAYENGSSEIYLYSELGRYVYKGDNPNNYLAIGSKLFRIISLDIQPHYVIGEDGKVVTINGEKQKENKYLIKVLSEDYLKDENGNATLPYGTRNDFSGWERKICNGDDCYIERQYMNSLVNDVYLQGLLNTGAGRLQIKNGTFNTGTVGPNYLFNGFGIVGNVRYEWQSKEIFDEEGYGSSTEPGKWDGICVDDVCAPNAGIMSLTDVLFASADPGCLDTIVIQGGVKCSNDNWIWRQQAVGAEQTFYRLMTRVTFKNTWLLSEINYLSAHDSTGEFKTRVALYLDADLYIMGSGTKDSPYVLYTMKKENN